MVLQKKYLFFLVNLILIDIVSLPLKECCTVLGLIQNSKRFKSNNVYILYNIYFARICIPKVRIAVHCEFVQVQKVRALQVNCIISTKKGDGTFRHNNRVKKRNTFVIILVPFPTYRSYFLQFNAVFGGNGQLTWFALTLLVLAPSVEGGGVGNEGEERSKTDCRLTRMSKK